MAFACFVLMKEMPYLLEHQGKNNLRGRIVPQSDSWSRNYLKLEDQGEFAGQIPMAAFTTPSSVLTNLDGLVLGWKVMVKVVVCLHLSRTGNKSKSASISIDLNAAPSFRVPTP